MEPARDEESSSASNSDLDAILREVEQTRRRIPPRKQEEDDESIEPMPPLAVVDPEPSQAPLPSASRGAGVRFEKHINLEQPGELKIRSFQLPKHAVVIGLLGLVAIGMWSIAPGGFDTLRPAPMPDSFRDASLRWTLVLTAERIDRYREEHMRVPSNLGELGIENEAVIYEPISDQQYQLRAADDTHVLELRPTTARENFLSSSRDILRQSPDKAP